MVTGTGILYDGTNTWIVNNEPPNALAFGTKHYTVDPDTVGQYTGLTDKNGKKIFEGDILESPIGRKAVVSFGTYKPWSTKDSDDFECWKLTLLAKNEGETKLECGLGKHCMEYMRIIGNIHDNPELLKECVDNG